MSGRIYVAKESFAVTLDGSPVVIRKGITRVSEGHSLLKGREHLFEPIDEHVHYGVEQATKAPGEKRGRRKSEPKPKAEKPEAEKPDAEPASDEKKNDETA
jgi:hypothetical protein